MDYQPGPSPGWTSSFNPPTPPSTPQPTAEVIPYDHSRYEMVILIVLSLAEVVVPHLGAYCSLAAGMLYLICSLPFLYWALVSRCPDGWTPSQSPWFNSTPGHDNYDNMHLADVCLYNFGSALRRLKPATYNKLCTQIDKGYELLPSVSVQDLFDLIIFYEKKSTYFYFSQLC
ncbi:hypothetical protein DSO57_1035412 [Entomophthora muscae]|uniref:Uncharacterized protein n=1 Tax=Entomophthora muscae TaxID=34485 RepID=A0ACC2REC4_9FUNG|nr:hypothetical protein DSO57_1035412 [Entomophthora muscae]